MSRRAHAVAFALACVLALAAIFARAWYTGAFLPEWTQWSEAAQRADLDGDGTAETVRVLDRRLSVERDGAVVYEAPVSWHVHDAFVGDMDRDGTPEVVALVWKHGSFGFSKPFWEHDTLAFSQHVFILSFSGERLKPRWMSSAWGHEFSGGYLDRSAHLHLVSPEGVQSVWAWESWGLALQEDETERERSVPAGEQVRFLAVGDVIAHRLMCSQAWRPEGQTYDFSPVFSQVAGRVGSYDIAVVNQETPLVSDYAQVSDFPVFGTPDTMADALAGAGFDVVLHATNHANDKGAKGVEGTLAHWRAHHPDVTVLGLHGTQADAQRICTVERNGIEVALLDYTYGLNGRALADGEEWRIDTIGDGDRLVAQLKEAERSADASVCFLHVGEEYASEPTAEQRALIERLVEAGADVIVCSHPHVLQGVEQVSAAGGNTALVYYSLGNFASNQTDERTATGGAASFTLVRDADGSVRVGNWELLQTECESTPQATTVRFR